MKLNVVINVKLNDEDKTMEIELSGDEMGVLIGKRGQTLDSLQYLVSLVVNKESEDYIRVKVDTENYRQRRKDTLENLAKNILIKTFDGEFETQKMFSYRKDFNMGDIVQVVSEYGRETRSQIMEMIISQDLSGYTTYPTFKILDNETGEESEVS